MEILMGIVPIMDNYGTSGVCPLSLDQLIQQIFHIFPKFIKARVDFNNIQYCLGYIILVRLYEILAYCGPFDNKYYFFLME